MKLKQSREAGRCAKGHRGHREERELKNTNLGGDEIDEDVTANIEMAHG